MLEVRANPDPEQRIPEVLETFFVMGNHCDPLVLSDDISLQCNAPGGYRPRGEAEKHIPECLRGMRERQELWELIFKPLVDAGAIASRQKILGSLLAEAQLPQIIAAKKALWGLPDGLMLLQREIHGDYAPLGSAIEVFLRDLANEEARQFVEEGFRLIDQGSNACLELLSILGDRHPELSTALLQLSTALPSLSRDVLLAKTKEGAPLFALTNSIQNLVSKTALVIACADLIHNERFSVAQFKPGESAFYTEGFSILCPASKNFRNPLTPDCEVTVFAGTNKSGKSESGLKQTFVIQLLAQSLGYSSVSAQNNFCLHDDLIYVDRCIADESKGLSSFGTEVINHLKLFELTQQAKAALVFLDEGYATTGPSAENQPTLWVSTVEKLRSAQNRIFATSHNSQIIDFARQHPNYQVYHFAVSLDTSRCPVYHYRLKEGADEAHSIEVARGQRFYGPALDIAEAVHKRETIPTPVATKKIKNIEQYSEEERLALKAHSSPNPRWRHAVQSHLFKVFGSQEQPTEKVIPHPEILGDTFGWYDGKSSHSQSFAGWHCTAGSSRDYLYSFLMDTPKLKSQEVLERQKTFAQLSERDCYDQVCLHQERILFGIHFLPYLSGHQHLLLEFNRVLNPFSSDGAERHSHDLGAAVPYLRMNKLLLGGEFQFNRLLLHCEKLTQFQARLDTSLQNWSDSEMLSYCESQKAVVLNSAEAEVVSKARAALSPSEPIPLVETRASLNSYFESLSDKSWQLRESPEYGALQRLDMRYRGLFITTENAYDLRRIKLELLIQDVELREEARVLLRVNPFSEDRSILPDYSLSECDLTPHEISMRAHDLSHFIGSTVSKLIPGVFLPAVCTEELGREVSAVCKVFKDLYREADCENAQRWERWPGKLLVALWLEEWADPVNHARELVNLLRSYDSVPLHQLSNRFLEDMGRVDTMQRSEISSRRVLSFDHESLPKAIEPTTDFKQIFVRQHDYFASKCKARWDELREISRPIDELYEAFGMIGPWKDNYAYDYLKHLKQFAAILGGDSKFNESLSSLYEHCARFMAFPHIPYPNDPSWNVTQANEYFIHTLGNSKTLDYITKVDQIILETGIKLKEFVKREKLDKNDRRSDAENRLEKIVEEVSLAKYALARKFNQSAPGSIEHLDDFKFCLTEMATYALLGRHLKLANFKPLTFNAEGRLMVNDMRYVANLSSVPQWVDMTELANPRVLAGPNMSGKSQHEKATCYLLLVGHATGHGPIGVGTIPLLEGIYYVERITGKDDNTLSAATIDLRNFNQVLSETESLKGRAYIGADELFSSMPSGAPPRLTTDQYDPDYNKCFTIAVAHCAYTQGHMVSISMHNPAALSAVEEIFPATSTIHFQYSLHPDAPNVRERIQYQRTPVRGAAPSEAQPVALSLGYPEDALTHGKAVLVKYTQAAEH